MERAAFHALPRPQLAANLFANVTESLLRGRYQQIFDRYELLRALMFADLNGA